MAFDNAFKLLLILLSQGEAKKQMCKLLRLFMAVQLTLDWDDLQKVPATKEVVSHPNFTLSCILTGRECVMVLICFRSVWSSNHLTLAILGVLLVTPCMVLYQRLLTWLMSRNSPWYSGAIHCIALRPAALFANYSIPTAACHCCSY